MPKLPTAGYTSGRRTGGPAGAIPVPEVTSGERTGAARSPDDGTLKPTATAPPARPAPWCSAVTKGESNMLKLLDYPNRVDDTDLGGAPHAADGANLDHGRDVPGYPTFVGWRSSSGSDVMVLIGFNTVNSEHINDVLKRRRVAIEAAANAAYKVGKCEVVLLAG